SLPVLEFTVVLSILTGVAMGIYPALESSRADLVDGLKEGGRGSSGSIKQHRFRKILVGAQVALSVTLLAGAALLITSFVKLSRQNIGFRPENMWIGLVTLPQAPYPDVATRQRFVEKTLAALQRIPSIQSATISADIPLIAAAASNALYTRPDGEILPLDKRAAAPSHNIAPDYFKTWGIPILAGRDFDQHDVADHQNVMLISQAGAALLLATVGIYGAVAYTVEQRTGEIGVRMALGAQTMDVLRLVVKQGMRPVIFGLAVGLAAALALGRLIAAQLYQTSAYNPL